MTEVKSQTRVPHVSFQRCDIMFVKTADRLGEDHITRGFTGIPARLVVVRVGFVFVNNILKSHY